MTEIDETARQAVIKYRKYLMRLTLNALKNNQIPSDRTVIDEINDRRKQFFKPRDV